MTRRLISAAVFAILTSACGTAVTVAPSFAADPTEDWAETQGSEGGDQAKPTHEQLEAAAARLQERRVGDHFVHRFSGSYRDDPVFLSEQIVGREGHLLVIDYRLEEGDNSSTLRIRFDPRRQQVARVSRLDGDDEHDASLADYEAMMQKTSYAPDYNEGRITRRRATCLVAGQEQDCVTTRYHVFVGEHPATLIVTQSEALPGRDISGTLKTEDGDIVYHSELVELHRGKPEPSVARSESARDYMPDEL
jgi:hypothetical protein